MKKKRHSIKKALCLACLLGLFSLAVPGVALAADEELFSPGEQACIADAPPITVGVIEGRYPYSALDEESGEITGILIDLCQIVSEKSGLSFQYALIPQGVPAVDWLEAGNGRLVAGVFYSIFNPPSERLVPSDTLFPSSYVVIGRKGEQFDAEAGLRVALPAGFIGGEAFTATQYPNAVICRYRNNEECADAVADGEADIMFQDMYVASRVLQSPRYENLMIFPAYEIPQELKLVMLKTDDPLLLSILNKAIAQVTDAEIDHAVMVHTVAKPYQVTWQDTFYKYKAPIHIIAILVALLITVTVVYGLSRRKQEKRILEKNAQLEAACRQTMAASRAKGDFLARMSHEIRTPMNAILGLTVLAESQTDDPAEVARYLDKIEASSQVLLSIINDVLDMSSIESGKLLIASAPFNLPQLIAPLTAVYQTQCGQKGVQYATELRGIVDEILIGDSLRLNQILMNLLSNAVKFTEKGSVTMTVEQRIARQDQLYLHITVADTGCGMSDAQKDRLWQPFEQGDATTAKKYGGSGLGLAIVKNLVALMGGAIEVASAVGRGSTFTVDLPFQRCPAEELQPAAGGGTPPAPIACDFSGCHLLLAEDNELNRIVAAGFLKKAGITLDMAENGKLALDRFLSSTPGQYDGILMDMEMPVMDGLAATRAIRGSSHPDAKTIPILAMTANAFTEDVAKCLQSGMNDHIAKPIVFDVLLRTLSQVLIKGEKPC